MNRRLYHLSFMMLVVMCHATFGQAYASGTAWTEKKLGKVIVRADKAAERGKWNRAIRYGKQAFEGVRVLNHPGDARYINMLNNLNEYYDKVNRLEEVRLHVEEAYILSRKYLDLAHVTTVKSRLLYYKILISQKEYHKTIPLVQESISILGTTKDDEFRLLHYLNQLYSLYGITKQYNKEEKTLLRLLKLNKRLLGTYLKDNIKIILSLARTYCIQKKTKAFDDLMKTYHLKYEC